MDTPGHLEERDAPPRSEIDRRRQRVFLPPVPSQGVRAYQDDHCANCLEVLPDTVKGLFCGPWCQQVARMTRYARAKRTAGTYSCPDIQSALGKKMAFALVGGYDERARRIPSELRDAVMVRDDGKCVQCGRSGEEVDHVEGSQPIMENLQLLCKSCHQAKTDKKMVLAPPDVRFLAEQWKRMRVESEEPLLLADDEVVWKQEYRRLSIQRRARLDPRRAEFWSRFEIVVIPEDEWEDLDPA